MDEILKRIKKLEKKMCCEINKNGIDTILDTPDYIIAAFLSKQILDLGVLVHTRDRWFGQEKSAATGFLDDEK